MKIFLSTDSDGLFMWGVKRGLRVIVALISLFATFVVISMVTGGNFEPPDPLFPDRAALYCIVLVPLALLYLAVAITSEALRRGRATKSTP